MEINLSPSSINCYLNSQLEFFYQYILKEEPDTKTIDCYGIAGTLVHTLLEEHIKTSKEKEISHKEFKTEWDKVGLNKLKGINNKVLDIDEYYQAYLIGLAKIRAYPKGISSEKEIIADFYNDEQGNIIKLKGIIDYIVDKDSPIIIDWKTSSKPKKEHELQANIYCYLTNITSCVMEYIKINKQVVHNFTNAELSKMGEFLMALAIEISQKGTNIDNYEPGKWDNIFNGHKEKCRKEVNKRLNSSVPLLNIEDTKPTIAYPNIDKQVLIVRQSCLSTAIGFSKDIDELMLNAEKLEKFVWRG